MYVSLSVCRILVPGICVRPEILYLFLYIDMIQMHDCQLKTPEEHLQGW